MICWGLFIVYAALSVVAARRFVPYEHRLHYGQCRKTWEYYLSAWLFNSIWIVAAVQNCLAPPIFPMWMRVTGLISLVFGNTLVIWAWRVNNLFVPAIIYVPPEIRVTDGPYRFCRHPGYVGFILAAIGLSWALGQWWSLYPLCAYVTLILRRMTIEDRILNQRAQ
jgi:protein-S-isoprenylcysteine O-methyltransferase Ste14